MEVHFKAKDDEQFHAEKRKAMLDLMHRLVCEGKVTILMLPKDSDYTKYIMRIDL